MVGCCVGVLLFTTVYNTKGTRAHTHRELIRKWLWEPETNKQSPNTGARANNTLHK